MVDQVACRYQKMYVFPLEEDFPPFPPYSNNHSNEGSINKSVDLEVGSVAHPNNQLEGVVKTLEEGSLSFVNAPLTDLIGPTLVEFPSSTIHFDKFFSFHQ